MPDASTGQIGRQVSGYRILEKLGAGGMGVVYKALDIRLNRPVALKFLSWDAGVVQHDQERFLQEARAASALDHPNIGAVHAIEATEDGQPFIVMAFYDGETLLRRIHRGPLPWRQAVDLALQIAQGLAEAHAKGIVHRDIKPSNLLITPQGVVKIIDFGVAKLADAHALTGTGAALGTAGYMSPEQATGAPADERSDLWSLGVVLYEMLTGHPPFHADSTPAILYAVVHQEPADSPLLVPEMAGIVRKLLAKSPAQRYQSAHELAQDLQRLHTGGLSATLTLATVPVANPRRRYAVWSSAGVLLAAALLGLLWRGLPRRAPPERYVAVLPFTNLGHDPGFAALGDGLMEVLTSELTDLAPPGGSLWVLPAAEVRGRRVSNPTDARRQLGATWVITGSLQQGPRGLRLTLNLVDARNLRQIGSAVLDESSSDFVRLQDVAVARLARLLETARKPAVARAGESSNTPAAYEWYLKGVGYLARYDRPGNADRALEAFQQAVRADPRFALAYDGVGQAYWSKYRLDLNTAWLTPALENCRKAIAINGQLAPVHVTMGRLHEGTGQHHLALQEFQRALELDRGNVDAYRGMGAVYQSLGRPEEAEASLRQSIALAPERWNSYNVLGAFYYQQQRYAEAERQFRRAVELTPDNAAAYGNLGGALMMQHKYGAAREAFQKSLAISPTYATYTNLGTVDLIQGYDAEAASLYEKAVALNVHDYRPWGGLGDAYQRSGAAPEKPRDAYARAAQLAEEALRANPADLDAHWNLAYSSAKLRRRESALRAIDKALLLAPDDPQVLEAAATVFEIFGLRARAALCVRQALRKGASPSSFQRDPDLRDLVRDPALAALFR